MPDPVQPQVSKLQEDRQALSLRASASSGSDVAPSAEELSQNRLPPDLEVSEANDQTLAEWWDTAHREQRELWLTGSRGPEVWEYLNITERLRQGQVVLNIGVGLGYCTHALVERGCVVHALDVSTVALERVSGVTAGAWLPEQLDELPVNLFDVAISNLVAQHMTDQDLLTQIRAVVRGLKPEGVFAMQFAYPLYGEVSDSNEQRANSKVGGVVRTPEMMYALVHQAGGQIDWWDDIGRFPEHSSGWYGIHIRKARSAAQLGTGSSS